VLEDLREVAMVEFLVVAIKDDTMLRKKQGRTLT
jgi:hypothetical protein